MEIDEAVNICSREFPRGLEIVANCLNAKIVYDNSLSGCEGWCVRHKSGKATIRINSNFPSTRQRSTLAHELGHLLDGSKTRVYGPHTSPYSRNETQAFEIGGKLLLPPDRIPDLILELPISYHSLKYLADSAGISKTMAAIQFVKISSNIGLKSAAIVGFNKSGNPNWVPVKAFTGVKELAQSLRRKMGGNKKYIVRIDNYIGFFVDDFHIKFMVIQETHASSGLTMSEVIKNFEDAELSDSAIRNVFQGRMSPFKIKLQQNEMTASNAVVQFLEKHENKWPSNFEDSLCSRKGRKYLKTRFRLMSPFNIK